ncbi:MAG TPA: ABC transporter ATP-binding protein [Sporosarcina psychrophila]|uniref:ABC transporter ATP-binding protein n=1 Tax=Sporosarcina psychrophila TaxID=1476 RepID=A0A921FWT4_SPOPS|nr:ABC transporter ATP-binding protein [Sporosarcina psychrophila]
MDTILELQNVTKSFKNKLVLERVSLSIPSNQVTAIIGKNGSGKSTLLKIIGGLTKPDSGQVLLRNGESVRIGYVPEVIPAVIPFTPVEYLTHMGAIRGLPKEWLQQRINTLLEMFHMEDDGNTRIVHFSKGMKQKVMIMQAMLEETDLLIMDEPISGLDPKAQTELEDLLILMKERKISVILTCHETKLLEKVVDQILAIHQGQITQTSSQQAQVKFMNRLVFELSNTVSIGPLRDKVIIQKETEIGSGRRVIELNVRQEQTNKVVKEFLDLGASIKLLAPLHNKETEFFQQF